MADSENPPMDPRAQLVKEKSLTMEYFLESRNLDKHTEQMLLDYDKNGDGVFQKDEVVNIIIDLRNAKFETEDLTASNRLFKRLLCLSIFLSILLLGGMFALSYTVAVLTNPVDVAADGTMMSTGSNPVVVATDSRAEVHIAEVSDVGYCFTPDEVLVITTEVVAGRQVLIELSDPSMGQSSMEQVSGGAVTEYGSAICFQRPTDGTGFCIQSNPACDESNSSGRRLEHHEREAYLNVHRQLGRRLPPGGTVGGNSCNCDCSLGEDYYDNDTCEDACDSYCQF